MGGSMCVWGGSGGVRSTTCAVALRNNKSNLGGCQLELNAQFI